MLESILHRAGTLLRYHLARYFPVTKHTNKLQYKSCVMMMVTVSFTMQTTQNISVRRIIWFCIFLFCFVFDIRHHHGMELIFLPFSVKWKSYHWYRRAPSLIMAISTIGFRFESKASTIPTIRKYYELKKCRWLVSRS